MNRKVAATLLLVTSTAAIYGAGRLFGDTVQLSVLYLCVVGVVAAAVVHNIQRQRRYGRQMTAATAEVRSLTRQIAVLSETSRAALTAVERLTVLLGQMQGEQREAKARIDDLRQLGTSTAVLLDLLAAPPEPPRELAGAGSSRTLSDG